MRDWSKRIGGYLSKMLRSTNVRTERQLVRIVMWSLTDMTNDLISASSVTVARYVPLASIGYAVRMTVLPIVPAQRSGCFVQHQIFEWNLKRSEIIGREILSGNWDEWAAVLYREEIGK
jgi:hypothetical protein